MAACAEIESSEEEINVKVKIGDPDRVTIFKIGGMKDLDLTPGQKVLLKSINQELWADGVDLNEFQSAIYGLSNDYEKIQPSWQSPVMARMPFLVPPNDTRTLLRTTFMGSFIWVGVNKSTIQRVPFLEAFCSDRWTKEIPTLTSVNPFVLRLVDFVFASGKDFVNTLITTMPLSVFCVSPAELIGDLDFLNVECKTEDLDSIDLENICAKIRSSSRNSLAFASKQESRAAAETLIFALSTDKIEYTKLSNRNKNQVYESVLFVASHFRVFGQNQRNNMKDATFYTPFTEKQEEKLEEWNDKFNFEADNFDDDCDSDNSSDDDYDGCFDFYRLGISRNYYGDSDYYYDSD